jgi:hypothetical protein
MSDLLDAIDELNRVKTLATLIAYCALPIATDPVAGNGLASLAHQIADAIANVSDGLKQSVIAAE